MRRRTRSTVERRILVAHKSNARWNVTSMGCSLDEILHELHIDVPAAVSATDHHAVHGEGLCHLDVAQHDVSLVVACRENLRGEGG